MRGKNPGIYKFFGVCILENNLTAQGPVRGGRVGREGRAAGGFTGVGANDRGRGTGRGRGTAPERRTCPKCSRIYSRSYFNIHVNRCTYDESTEVNSDSDSISDLDFGFNTIDNEVTA